MAGLGRPAIGRLVTAGVLPSLSVDSETAAAADMFTQLRMARAADPAITARDTLAMAITHGARAVGLDHRIGSLTPGKQADLILLHPTPSTSTRSATPPPRS
ncbi:MAG: 5-methylthioadenosine/S-adenosylhomocysteine deaminase [Kribbellaceae bacterium]|nr:5-methylthioadenosine/S-adenosylhomocysteine deaminase [Kribbellaceae bacterium]